MRRLVNGERDTDQLVAGMGPLGRELLISCSTNWPNYGRNKSRPGWSSPRRGACGPL